MIAKVAKAISKAQPSRVEAYVIEDTLGVIALFFLLYLGLATSSAL
jgi:hypothetical protein